MTKLPSAFVLGRFQPLHLGHIDLIRGALNAAEKVLVIIGSANEAISLKNPFDYKFREVSVYSAFAKQIHEGRLVIDGLEDYPYNSDVWNRRLNEVVSKHLHDPVFYTYGKDAATTAYIGDVKYEKVFHEPKYSYNATDIRKDFFSNPDTLKYIHEVSPHTKLQLTAYMLTEDYERLCKELQAINEYKQSWAGSPFPPQFMATDAMVEWIDPSTRKSWLLVIKRKSEFGNGKLALPGGYLDQNETFLQGAIRELQEETGLTVDDHFVLDTTVMIDDPNRSMRGRMVTMVHAWRIFGVYERQVVKGADDAAVAFWMPLENVVANRTNFFSDHFHIICKIHPELIDGN